MFVNKSAVIQDAEDAEYIRVDQEPGDGKDTSNKVKSPSRLCAGRLGVHSPLSLSACTISHHTKHMLMVLSVGGDGCPSGRVAMFCCYSPIFLVLNKARRKCQLRAATILDYSKMDTYNEERRGNLAADRNDQLDTHLP